MNGPRCVYCLMRFTPRAKKGERLICNTCWKIIVSIASEPVRSLVLAR